MKNFNDFLESIDTDTYRTIQFSAEQSMNMSGLHGTGDKAYFIALSLLELYHNWINMDDE